jgi:hypothetical protein
MDRQAIEVHGTIEFSNANRALPKTVDSADVRAGSDTCPTLRSCLMLSVRGSEAEITCSFREFRILSHMFAPAAFRKRDSAGVAEAADM